MNGKDQILERVIKMEEFDRSCISLEKFLIEHEKLPQDSRVSDLKLETIKLFGKFADKVYKIGHTWYLQFGLSECSIKKINQKYMHPIDLLYAVHCEGFEFDQEKFLSMLKEYKK